MLVQSELPTIQSRTSVHCTPLYGTATKDVARNWDHRETSQIDPSGLFAFAHSLYAFPRWIATRRLLRAASKILLLTCRSGLTVFEFAKSTDSRRLPPAGKAEPWTSRSHKIPPAPSTAPAFRVVLGPPRLRALTSDAGSLSPQPLYFEPEQRLRLDKCAILVFFNENQIKWQVTSGDSGAHRVDSVCDQNAHAQNN
ncbi:hypothetical protein [Bradyrhizobium sp. 172]|uniref:hypothetical protein n=1 Tax=Bradyrhizobium sp. 172 TaxID=2782643 RepID=UPI001FFFBA8C|nr:hypothetical protein [Bradyrhizobium sp. 172]UPJ94558.1 hypothetical protein IVB07_29345 [Bradyrhizobium sp. 172]